MNWTALLIQLLPVLPQLITNVSADIEAMQKDPNAFAKVQHAADALGQLGNHIATATAALSPQNGASNG